MMVIACYAGVGKSTFAKANPSESIDLCSMPYSWILPGRKEEGEKLKAAPYLLRHPAYPGNYLAAILEAEARYEYVLIPSSLAVLNHLYTEYEIPYLLCYPGIECKEEYKQRYVARGNSEDFTDIFTEQWEERITALENDENGIHFRLARGQFLTDIKADLDNAIRAAVNGKKEREQELPALKECVDIISRQSCLWFMGGATHYYYPVDLTIEENRKWVFDIGKLCYEKDISIMIDGVQFLESFYDHGHGADVDIRLRKLSGRQDVLQMMEKLAEL